MNDWRIIPAAEHAAWDAAIQQCGPHDVYHTNAYNRMLTDDEHVKSVLFVVEAYDETAALPIRIQRIDDGEALDASSPYGYPGAITSCTTPDQGLQARFTAGLQEAMAEAGAISLFVRQHPLFETHWLFGDGADIVEHGQTVAIDLSNSEAEIQAGSSQNHRRNLKKAAKLGLSFVEDHPFEFLDEFAHLYDTTMRRVEAEHRYFFPRGYFRNLKELLDDRVSLFHARSGDATVSSVIMFHCGDIVQYHLGGTDNAWADRGASRWLLEQTRIWAKLEGYRWFHLGGGVDAKEDSLFRFKAGFAKSFWRFRVVQLVLNGQVYDDLTRARSAHGHQPQPGFFPAYRG